MSNYCQCSPFRVPKQTAWKACDESLGRDCGWSVEGLMCKVIKVGRASTITGKVKGKQTQQMRIVTYIISSKVDI
jgi:hypothetical protein